MNALSGVFPPQHVKTQLDARHADQIEDGPFEAKANHREFLNEALVNFSRRRPMIGLKPTFWI